MQESSAVGAAAANFWATVGTGDIDQLAATLTRDDLAQVIGSAPGEGHDDRATWIQGFGSLLEHMPGVKVDPGRTRGYENGDTGYALTEPVWHLPNGMSLSMRATHVLQREDGEWRVVHLHASVGVPDETAVQMQMEGAATA
jgi:ketosteroid isomerase-like protein